MPISQKKKEATQRWDNENMRSLSCRVRTSEAALFREYCHSKGKAVYTVIKEFIIKCNDEYMKNISNMKG